MKCVYEIENISMTNRPSFADSSMFRIISKSGNLDHFVNSGYVLFLMGKYKTVSESIGSNGPKGYPKCIFNAEYLLNNYIGR